MRSARRLERRTAVMLAGPSAEPAETEQIVRRSWVISILAVLALVGVQPWLHPAWATTTYVVNSTSDPGDGICDPEECTLREAVAAANTDGDVSTITFSIGEGGLQTISPISSLPDITAPVTIDATTQPGFAGAPIIELSGAGAGTANGLRITGGSSTVKGLVINRFRGWGIELAGARGNRLEGNYIGIDASGTVALGNAITGVLIRGSHSNIVGGTAERSRNVISGNGEAGIHIVCCTTPNNRIEGNYIGTDATGTTDLGNSDNGVWIEGSLSTVVGGTAVGAGNVISGNEQAGVEISFSFVGISAPGNKVEGNYIGTDASGTADLGNAGDGVYIWEADSNTVGGSTTAARNVISGNSGSGVRIFSGSTRNKVEGNYIGTDATGTAETGNRAAGVAIEDSSSNIVGGTAAGARNVISGNGHSGVLIHGLAPWNRTSGNRIEGNYIGAAANGTTDLGNLGNGVAILGGDSNTVGGTATGAGNVVSGNGRTGIVIIRGEATGNRVERNFVGTNDGIGIDLDPSGVTENDPGDPDGGANNLQNFPVVSSASSGGGGTTVRGTLNSTPGTRFTLEFFSNSACDGSGHGEGERFLGSTTLLTDGGGNANFTASFPTAVPTGQFVTATATDPSGNTSEFSECRRVRRSSGF
jgi:CSLREA domain-containing protein